MPEKQGSLHRHRFPPLSLISSILARGGPECIDWTARAYADPHMTSVLLIDWQLPVPPFSWQRLMGMQKQLGVPEQAAGKSAQYRGGGVQGGGMHPGPTPVAQFPVYVHPDGHWPPSGSFSQTATPPPQLGRTQICPVEHGPALPQGMPWPPAPPVPACPPVPSAPPAPPVPGEPPLAPPAPACPPSPPPVPVEPPVPPSLFEGELLHARTDKAAANTAALRRSIWRTRFALVGRVIECLALGDSRPYGATWTSGH